MSNAAFTNNFPNLLKNFSQKLFQPTGIAVLASVGIHVALGVSLPYLTVSSKEQPQKGTVQLVNLSPAEQSRIPQLSPSPLPNQLSSLYPLPPGLSTPYPPLTSSGLPSNWSPSPLNGLASNKRSPSTTSTSVTSSTPSLKSPKTTQLNQSTSPNLQQTGKNYAITTSPTRIQGLTNRRDIPSLGLTPAQLPPPAQPPLPPPPLYPPAGGNEPILQARSNPSFTTTPSSTTNPTTPTPSSTNNPTPAPSVSPSTTPITTNNPGTTRSLPGSTTNTTAPSTALPAPPSNLPQTPAFSKPSTSTTNNSAGTSSAGTSNDEYQRRTIAALAQTGASEIKKHPVIAGNYPKPACVEQLSGTTLVQAQVDSQGTVGATTVISPSKIPMFDEAAEIAISGMNFGAGKPVAYQVPVEFKYDSKVCGNATVPKNSAQPQSIATPQNSPTPKKSPEAFNVPTTQDSPAPKKSPEV